MAELPPTAGLDVDDVEAFETAPTERIGDLRRSIESVIRGKSEVVGRTLVTLFAEGHLLIEDVPGVGKTMLAQALARSLDVSFRRLQFTSDLLPSDILGVSIYQPATSSFEFKPGPIFSHVLLADEINRASPKTQSAMLEAMNEAQVSIDSTSYPLAQPFIVLATQNPVEHQGTYPLPESQLDRFLMRVRMGYPDSESERQLLETQKVDHPIDAVEPVLSALDVVRIQRAVRHVAVVPGIADYIVRLATATRTSEKLALGVSPRGSLLLQRASQAQALLEDRRFVVPDDVKSVAASVLGHRVIARGPSDMEGIIEGTLRYRFDEALADARRPSIPPSARHRQLRGLQYQKQRSLLDVVLRDRDRARRFRCRMVVSKAAQRGARGAR